MRFRRRTLFSLFLTMQSVFAITSDDENFINAVKNLIFSNEQYYLPPSATNTSQPMRHYALPQQSPVYAVQPSYPQYYVGPQSPANPCRLPQQVGTGPYRIPRWFFNPTRMRCELFYWSGCCGNANNFPSIQSCQQQCEESRCELRVDEGSGRFNLTRFFFDSNRQQCRPFRYRGANGNQNNFLTLSECRRRCKESPSPCAYGAMVQPIQCSPGTVAASTCSGQQFCHVGASPQTTVCCAKPATGDPCAQPMNLGVGNANLQRWYFNAPAQSCQPLSYRGLQGNENNFLSRDQCEVQCQVNPCRVGIPFRSANGIAYCSATDQGACPAGYYCHIGGTPQTTVCCQALVKNACVEPKAEGDGDEHFVRYYFDQTKSQCLPFEYSGLKGNSNNFLSKSSCEKKCPLWSNPCSRGQPILGANNKPMFCHSGSPCPSNYFCHLGSDSSTTVCCPEGSSDICAQPLNIGVGGLVLNRWFYNSLSRHCERFVYKGLHGNSNNFLAKEQCEVTCPTWENPCPSGQPILNQKRLIPTVCNPLDETSCPPTHWCHRGVMNATIVCCPGRVDPCLLAQSEDLSVSAIRISWDKRQCEECEKRCVGDPCPQTATSTLPRRRCALDAEHKCPRGFWCHHGGRPETTVCCPNVGKKSRCFSAFASAGIGDRRLQRWSFDSDRRECHSFTYFGLKGSANNFFSKEECQQKCLGKKSAESPIDSAVSSLRNLISVISPHFAARKNPCRMGTPLEEPNGGFRECQPNWKCPRGFFCHLGELSSVCCPATGTDPCGQPVDSGTGSSRLQRWYWNQQRQCCMPFNYCGLRGTQNNFLSRQDCERTCLDQRKICEFGNPLRNPNGGQLIRCEFEREREICGENHFCDLGPNGESFCCPSELLATFPTPPPLIDNRLPEERRWLFDVQTGKCEESEIADQKGKPFLSEAECLRLLNAINPCKLPVTLPLEQCQPGPGSCSTRPGMYCHIGGTPQTTVCCPAGVGDFCRLPMDPGVGEFRLERWFHNAETGSCQPFLYAGLKGNPNNFLTQSECELLCVPNPCAEGRPYMAGDGRPLTCSPSGSMNTCPTDHWCHVGAGPQTTVCCPGATHNPCSLPMSTGEGNAVLERFYFDQSSKTCKPFLYKGLKGNQNNYLTQRSCELACLPLDNPCIGQPATTPSGQVLFCSATNRDTCPVNFWCHLGSTPETTVCCPGATNACSVPLAPGTGNAGLARWYYNADERQCVQFQYNGKRGNQNNFLTQAECDRTCPEQLCLLSIDKGACNGQQTRYAYNRQTNLWGTCQGCNPKASPARVVENWGITSSSRGGIPTATIVSHCIRSPNCTSEDACTSGEPVSTQHCAYQYTDILAVVDTTTQSRKTNFFAIQQGTNLLHPVKPGKLLPTPRAPHHIVGQACWLVSKNTKGSDSKMKAAGKQQSHRCCEMPNRQEVISGNRCWTSGCRAEFV